MNNKKKIIISCIAAIIIVLVVVFFLFESSSFSVIGKWKINYYITDEGHVSSDDIGYYYGELYQTANNAFSIVFKTNNESEICMPTYQGAETEIRKCSYEIRGNEIYLSADGDMIKGFEIKDNTLVMYNILGFDGDVVLKKE